LRDTSPADLIILDSVIAVISSEEKKQIGEVAHLAIFSSLLFLLLLLH
jgi:hypothetical protein